MAEYWTEATAWGGREGRSATADGALDVILTTPKELGGEGKPGTNPEQLFATGWAGCFHGALKLMASKQDIDLSESAVTVQVGIEPDADGGLRLQAKIEAEMPGVDQAKGQELVEAAHRFCPYSKATRDNIEVTVTATR